jgi:hypothetical protein
LGNLVHQSRDDLIRPDGITFFRFDLGQHSRPVSCQSGGFNCPDQAFAKLDRLWLLGFRSSANSRRQKQKSRHHPQDIFHGKSRDSAKSRATNPLPFSHIGRTAASRQKSAAARVDNSAAVLRSIRRVRFGRCLPHKPNAPKVVGSGI